MDKPVIAARKPKVVQLAAGKDYMWCACGRSRNQPFCDGSHAGTSFKPLAFKAKNARCPPVRTCAPKLTHSPPGLPEPPNKA